MILMVYMLYHIQLGIANITSCLHQSTEGKYFMEKKVRNRSDIKTTVRVERSEHIKRRSMPRSCTYAFRNTTKDERFDIHGIPERKEQSHDIREMGEHEV